MPSSSATLAAAAPGAVSTRQPTGGAALWWAALAAEAVLLLAPLFATDWPPLCDLPNHMARLYILALNGSDPTLAAMYRPAWHVLPNLAMDGIGVPMVRAFGVTAAARILLGLQLLLGLGGAIALHRATFGRRSYWPLAAGLVAFNAMFLMGFMNYVFGADLALFGAATAASRQPILRRWRVALSVAWTVVIFFAHIYGLVFYFVLLFAQRATEVAWHDRARRLRQAVAGCLALAAPAAAAVALVLAMPRGDHSGAVWSNLRDLAAYALGPVINYNERLDALTAVVLLGLVAAAAMLRLLRAPPASLVALAVLGVLFLVCPWGERGAYFQNARIPACVAALACAGFDLRPATDRTWRRVAFRLAGVGLAALLVVRMAVVGAAWHESRRDLADIRDLGALLPLGAKVLVTRVLPHDDHAAYFAGQPRWRELPGIYATFVYLPALWTIERQVFMPLIFADPAEQPLAVTDAFRPLAVPVGVPPDYRVLADPALLDATLRVAPYLAHWARDFDYVVILAYGRARHLDRLSGLPLTLVRATDIAGLYRIAH